MGEIWMNIFIRTVFVGLGIVVVTLSFNGQAHAWGCSAEAADGAAGDSSSFTNREDAEEAALEACQSATTQRCVISGCWPDA